MLTDIFLNRYADVPLWPNFGEHDRRFLVQAFRIVEEQVYPYFKDGKVSEPAKQKWQIIHARLSTELGLMELSQRFYSYQETVAGKSSTCSGFFEWNYVCQKFVCAIPDNSILVDQFMKARISFFEIAFREFYEDVQRANEELPSRMADWDSCMARTPRPGILVPTVDVSPKAHPLELMNRSLNDRYNSAIEEFNTRARQARYALHYHNGFVQISNDEHIKSEIEQPFWAIVSAPIWKNVDTDMKEALDRRDGGRRDPAFYAARALESTIKIISDLKGWTHGSEKGAHNYLDNLGSKKNGMFIESWEKQALKGFFH